MYQYRDGYTGILRSGNGDLSLECTPPIPSPLLGTVSLGNDSPRVHDDTVDAGLLEALYFGR